MGPGESPKDGGSLGSQDGGCRSANPVRRGGATVAANSREASVEAKEAKTAGGKTREGRKAPGGRRVGSGGADWPAGKACPAAVGGKDNGGYELTLGGEEGRSNAEG